MNLKSALVLRSIFLLCSSAFSRADPDFGVDSIATGGADIQTAELGHFDQVGIGTLDKHEVRNYAFPNPQYGFARVDHHLLAGRSASLTPSQGQLRGVITAHTIVEPMYVETSCPMPGGGIGTNSFPYPGYALASVHAEMSSFDRITVSSASLPVGSLVDLAFRFQLSGTGFPVGSLSTQAEAKVYTDFFTSSPTFSARIAENTTMTGQLVVSCTVGSQISIRATATGDSFAVSGTPTGTFWSGPEEMINSVRFTTTYNVDVITPGVTLSSASGTNYSLGTPGDADHSGGVNFNDLLVLAQNYGTPSDATWEMGDFTFDGAVNFPDLLALAQHYVAGSLAANDAIGSSQFRSDWQLAVSMVPEPTSISVLLAIAVFELRRRR